MEGMICHSSDSASEYRKVICYRQQVTQKYHLVSLLNARCTHWIIWSNHKDRHSQISGTLGLFSLSHVLYGLLFDERILTSFPLLLHCGLEIPRAVMGAFVAFHSSSLMENYGLESPSPPPLSPSGQSTSVHEAGRIDGWMQYCAAREIGWLLIVLWTFGLDFPRRADFSQHPSSLFWNMANNDQTTHTHRPIQTHWQSVSYGHIHIYRNCNFNCKISFICAFNVNRSR